MLGEAPGSLMVGFGGLTAGGQTRGTESGVYTRPHRQNAVEFRPKTTPIGQQNSLNSVARLKPNVRPSYSPYVT